MRSVRNRFALCCALAAALAIAAGGAEKAGKFTALDRYVQAPDPNYKYELVRTIPGDGYTAYVLDMTSQKWRTEKEVDRPIWKHWVTIVKPDRVAYSTGFLFITGGSNKDKAPEKVDALIADTAMTTHSVVTELRMVPNQPLVFPDDGVERVEDGIIAYTWDKFLRGGDDQWPLRLPMTKAAVRAMDTVTSFMASAQGGGVKVDKFVVAGGSKRGWTTWTTAAVDRRVVAIAPMVIDLLNIEPSFIHHWRAYGFWAPAVKDYEQRGIMDWAGTPRYRELMKEVEPYSYRDRLTMPKFLINSAGDQFFLPDSSQFYFDDLKGEKYLRYVPNTDHSLRNSDARQSLIAFYDAFLRNQPRPKFSWKFEKDGSIRVKTNDKPTEVKLWQATNPNARDFRLAAIGPAYQSTALNEEGAAGYVAKVTRPAKGWTAYFVELTFPSGGKYPFKFTTAVRVEPDVLPYPPPKPARAMPPVQSSTQ
ncbi:MAG TPA: PhoPQ-activated pathogenicity-related family protein [Bryobacteraceae bacterium]|jgi:PhoPQ-activated pathogenicity-related protein|nr:PhoPQ-activated pathogenicity-related family protein [Bryobacteraceae bacterium]